MCTISWAYDYRSTPRWVVVLCMYRRYENMRLATKASHDQRGKQALRERSVEMEALEQWERSHEGEWPRLHAKCESEWRERQEPHGQFNFGRETFVHVALDPKNQAAWDKQNEESIVQAMKQAFCKDDYPNYIRPETPTEVPHPVRIFVDLKKGAAKTLRHTLW